MASVEFRTWMSGHPVDRWRKKVRLGAGWKQRVELVVELRKVGDRCEALFGGVAQAHAPETAGGLPTGCYPVLSGQTPKTTGREKRVSK